MASIVFSLDLPLPVLRAPALISSGLHCPSSEYALGLLEAPCLCGAESQQAQRTMSSLEFASRRVALSHTPD